MITLDEAIKHCEEKAEELKYEAEHFGESIAQVMKKETCLECAKEHEQLAKWLTEYKELVRPRGTYECFHCGQRTVVWGADFDFSDFGYEGEGIVHTCTCANCGAEIEYRIALGDNEDGE